MNVHIRGAREHNLKNIDIDFGNGLTVVTGVSGSGKTSLVLDTLYHEAHRRFLDVYLYGRGGQRLAPANVEKITGLGPTIAVGQNLLNRNPNSTLASASGLHPFFRLLYTNFGERRCLQCGEPITVLSEDAMVDRLVDLSKQEAFNLYVPLVRMLRGSHKSLLSILQNEFEAKQLFVDGQAWDTGSLDPGQSHTIEIQIGWLDGSEATSRVRALVKESLALGSTTVRAQGELINTIMTASRVCTRCGAGLAELRATHFNRQCPYCEGDGCWRCDLTGMHPQAASVHWEGMRLPELLRLTVSDSLSLMAKVILPSTANRLRSEINRRLTALEQVGLGYIALNRPAPTLSRGESQRVRLAISLSSRLEDVLHVLDEPTIGQHAADIARFLPAFRDLAGPVIYIEHDRVAAAAADHAIDLGPGAGVQGGEVLFSGPPFELWRHDSATGRFFSLQERVMAPDPRPPAEGFLHLRGANKFNLLDIDVEIPLARLSVITGVSGSGKSTLLEHVLMPSLKAMKPIGCSEIEGPKLKAVMVNQSPIGRNPRSNPATYTKLAGIIRDLFAEATGLSKSHFSFNRPEGACPECNGIGAAEIKMRYLPSIWLPCEVCVGQRFKPEILEARINLGGSLLSVADVYATSIAETGALIEKTPMLTAVRRKSAARVLKALNDLGLGYLELGQSSPTLSGGEAQRVKLSKYLGRQKLTEQLLLLDEPSTGLHPRDLYGLLSVLDRLVRHGATVVIVEHNTDFIRAADWVIDLGPGAGPAGGQLLYQGPPDGLLEIKKSQTRQALKNEANHQPGPPVLETANYSLPSITIRNARANNLKGVDVTIPKGKLTIVTGVSGSGKSSLVGDVLQTEARRRYLESLSMYERQGLREGPEAQVDSVTGLGVTLTVSSQQAHTWSQLPQYTRRNSVGSITEISFHLANLMASLGERDCPNCESTMVREEQWVCPNCGVIAPIARPRHFSSAHWSSSCKHCSGLGVLHAPQPEKLIIHPEKPLCAGAMFSPGYWPQSYLCKDQPVIAEIGKRYGFNPLKTPWDSMTKEAQNAFLYGDGHEYTWTYVSKGGRSKGQERQVTRTWSGFYGEDSWIFDWDVHGTYTKEETCPECNGTGLLPDYLAVTLKGRNIFDLNEISIEELESLTGSILLPPGALSLLETSLDVVEKRLRFLRQVGIGYLHLNRPTGTLSAGEAQRIQLASLLGSGLTALTILVDEPSRGMHPVELEALRDALMELRDQGNSVVVIEHDPLLIRAADHIIDMGPGAGVAGGKIVAQGDLSAIVEADSVTGKWLRSNKKFPHNSRRLAKQWMIVRGARENNLRGDDVAFPLGTLTGICGVSGSGKSTLVIDTIGRALVRKLHSTSFAQEPVAPGEHDGLENQPKRAFLVDQSRRGISSPANYLGLEKGLIGIFADSDDARSLGLSRKTLSERCSACRGQGVLRMKMGFLPDEWLECETCQGTGHRREAWDVRIGGVSLPEINALTIDEVYQLLKDETKFASRLDILRQVGLGYLVWKQATFTLSGGEVQRMKVAKELVKKTSASTLYIFDEPTVGLHLDDVARLVDVLNQLVDAGHTVLTVEHHPHLLAACDWLIELGPVGGPGGGKVIATGPPEEVMKLNTPTAPYLRSLLV